MSGAIAGDRDEQTQLHSIEDHHMRIDEMDIPEDRHMSINEMDIPDSSLSASVPITSGKRHMMPAPVLSQTTPTKEELFSRLQIMKDQLAIV